MTRALRYVLFFFLGIIGIAVLLVAISRLGHTADLILGWRAGPQSTVEIQSSIESLKQVGELVVMKGTSKEIATATHWEDDHSWLLTRLSQPKKAAYVIKFEFDFRYDLRSPEFKVENDSGKVLVSLPPLRANYAIKDVTIYDKSDGVWGWSEYHPTVEEENQLLKEATATAIQQSQAMMAENRTIAESSAREILLSIFTGIGVDKSKVAFR